MTVRIGFVGAGGIANHHMRSLTQVQEAEMVAFCDVDPEKARSAASTHGGRDYSSFNLMYDNESLDGVYICVPPFAHGDAELEAVRRGLALFVEKPVAATAHRADEILKAVESSGTVTSVGYHWRYMDTVERARQLIGTGAVGFAVGAWEGGMPGVSWWRRMEQSGGQMVEQTTHIFDLARYLLGEVSRVHAFSRSGLMADVADYSVHDACVTNLEFDSGVIASITSACMLSAGGQVGLDVFLKDQVLQITSMGLSVVGEGEETLSLANNPTACEDQAFVEALASGDVSGIRSDYADAVKTLKLTLGATRSAIEGKPVDL